MYISKFVKNPQLMPVRTNAEHQGFGTVAPRITDIVDP